MSAELPSLLATVPEIGHGNPQSARTVFDQLVKTGQFDQKRLITARFSVLPTKIYHKLMTSSLTRAEKYVQDDGLRKSRLAEFLGRLMFKEMMLGNGRLLKKRPAWVLTQEFPLYEFTNDKERLAQLFKQVFLLIPDSFPKDSALQLLFKLHPFVTPIVWLKQTYESLKNLNLEPLLVAPFLTPNLTESSFQNTVARHQYGVVKSSGSGTAKGLMPKLVAATQSVLPNQPVYEYDTKKSSYHLPHNSYPIIKPTLAEIYAKLSRARVISSYPSEIAMIAATIASLGGKIDVLALPPRGRHEFDNLTFLKELGIAIPLNYRDGKLGFYESGQPDHETRTKRAHEAVGTEPISQAILKIIRSS